MSKPLYHNVKKKSVKHGKFYAEILYRTVIDSRGNDRFLKNPIVLEGKILYFSGFILCKLNYQSSYEEEEGKNCVLQ